jgi:3D (Asp-Asp-Asp) domain-containing protein
MRDRLARGASAPTTAHDADGLRPGKSTLVSQAYAATAEATPPPQVQWLEQPFQITHYTFALETDPIHASSPLVQATGLNEPHRDSFLYGDRGIMMQGTGQASDGQYITIDWNQGGPNGRNTVFTYGIGGQGGRPVPWKTVASDPAVVPSQSRVLIEAYQDKGEMLANDTGGAIRGNHLDVFIGGATIAEAFELGTKTSRVAILSGARYPSAEEAAADKAKADADKTGTQDPTTTTTPPTTTPPTTITTPPTTTPPTTITTPPTTITTPPTTTTTPPTTTPPTTTPPTTTTTPPTATTIDPAEQPAVAARIAKILQEVTAGTLSAARDDAHAAATEYRAAHHLAATASSPVTDAYGRAYAVAAKLADAQRALDGRRFDDALALARAAGPLATALGDQGLAPAPLVAQILASIARLVQLIEEAKARAPRITAEPGPRQLVGSSLGALGDRLIPASFNLDRDYPHHGDASDAHEERAVEFDGAGRVADTTWPTSLAVPTVMIDGAPAEITTRSPRPILDVVASIRATDFTIASRSDPDNASKDIGQVIVSPFDMKVVDTSPGHGLVVLEQTAPTTIALGNGKTALIYERIAVLHLDTVTVATGSNVAAGQQIGTQGNTKTVAVHNHIAGTNQMRIDFINAQTRAFR